jgi:hypothetical protein
MQTGKKIIPNKNHAPDSVNKYWKEKHNIPSMIV